MGAVLRVARNFTWFVIGGQMAELLNLLSDQWRHVFIFALYKCPIFVSVCPSVLGENLFCLTKKTIKLSKLYNRDKAVILPGQIKKLPKTAWICLTVRKKLICYGDFSFCSIQDLAILPQSRGVKFIGI